MLNNQYSFVRRADSFITKARSFLTNTQQDIQEVSPGGCYRAIWCRDAAYILKEQFLSGNVNKSMQQAFQIWSHQIKPDGDKLVCGRGSPKMSYTPAPVPHETKREFAGALPTTIYQEGFSEVYAENPDLDSTGLMISSTSWILARALKNGQLAPEVINSMQQSSDEWSAMQNSFGTSDPMLMIELVIDRMENAIQFMARRDVDNDALLEQTYNEDWMDTALRAGKVVYSQACWISALNEFSALQSVIGKDVDSARTREMATRAIRAVESNLWSEGDRSYIDHENTIDGWRPSMLTQDVSLYLVALTDYHAGFGDDLACTSEIALTYKRANLTLDAIRNRTWKDNWPLVSEAELRRTGPGLFGIHNYHNWTFWPWTTAIEMLARGRFGRVEECELLLTILGSENDMSKHAFWEWINPITSVGSGAFPFRTGVSAIRIAISDILENLAPKL